MIKMFDNATGSIDVNGFSQLFTYVNQWMSAFRAYDSDQSGFINSQELMSALQTMVIEYVDALDWELRYFWGSLT
jgi:Ca2+-binding EF-hand superfamily protein